MAAIEQADTRTFGWDRNGKEQATRTWLVDGEPPIAKHDPQLPAPKSQFPGVDELFLDSYQAQLYNPATPSSKVIGTYTTDGSGTFGGNKPVDPTDPNFNSWTVDYQRYDVSIPFVQVNPAKYGYTDTRTGTERQIVGYDDAEEVHTESRMVISKEVVIQGQLNITEIETIGDLTDSIVRVGTRFWRFSIGQLKETTANRWQTSYMLESDRGTPDVYRSTPQLKFPTALVSVIPGVVYPNRTFARPPFHKVVLAPGDYDAGPPPFIGPPQFVAEPMYVANLTALRTLPGWRD